MNHAVHTKDHLFGLLNETNEQTPMIANVETVLTVLMHTEGLWQECTYCYKAMELAQVCDAKLRTVETTNHKRAARIERLQRLAWALSDKYFQLQQESMQQLV